MSKDLSSIFDAQKYAIYLPALSGFYSTMLGKYQNDPTYIPADRIPKGMEKGIGALDYLKEDGYYHYKYSLFSAGHAELDLAKASVKEPMVHKRDRNKTLLVGDSGGFQVATGVIKMDWATVKGPEGDVLRSKILNWLENTACWSMTLDVPAFAAVEPLSKRTGLTKFEDTLDISVHNLHYFMKNRTPGKTKFLNVISGSSVENGRTWYNEVKKFSDPNEVAKMGYSTDRTLEGYAFAGIHMKNMYATLERLLNLKDDGLLENKGWIHFLGLGRLDWACFLTSVQRQIQKHYNPDLQVSFDAASPFVATAYGQCYNYNHFNSKKFIYSMAPAPDKKSFEGNHTPMPFLSPIMERLTLHDLCPLSEAHALIDGEHRYDVSKEEVEALAAAGVNAEWIEERLNRLGKTSRTSWDTLTYLLYMSHNVYKHIEAVAEANRIADVEYLRHQPHWRNWIKEKRTSKANEISDFVPSTILYFRSFVEELFDPFTTNPYELLVEFKPFLDHISFGGTNSNTFGSFFQEEIQNGNDSIDQFADLNNEKLNELEKDGE